MMIASRVSTLLCTKNEAMNPLYVDTHLHTLSFLKKINTSLPNFPSLVYRWFLFIYQITYALGIIGYIILLLVFTGFGLLLPISPDMIMEFGVVLIFYGVYYGVMGRDCAELCVDFMAAAMTVSYGNSL